MKNQLIISILFGLFSITAFTSCAIEDEESLAVESISQILTSADGSRLLQEKVSPIEWDDEMVSRAPTISINLSTKYQKMDGFGYTLTGGSAILLSQMSTTARSKLLRELFGRGEGEIGVNYLRLSVGASDLDPEVYTYNDLPQGETDVDLSEFSIDRDRSFLLPILKEILAINPDIKILSSPWSPPVWMKDNGNSIGGSLLPQFYDPYANYLVKYVEAMAAEGVRIDALTIQNEPLHPGNNPSLLMLAEDQQVFVRDHLGPAFAKTTLSTKLIVYDHNCDKPEYPLTILDDPEAKKFIDGSAFHLYGGEISALSTVHDAHPDKHLYFTEQYTNINGNFAEDFMWHAKALHIDAPNNWAKNVLEWNLAADPTASIHTPGGCTVCLGAITIDGDSITRNAAYYSVAHSSKWVPDGSQRVATTQAFDGVPPHVAYVTPSGKTVLIAINEEETEKEFIVVLKDKSTSLRLPARTVGTFKF